MPHEVFISYASPDKVVADAVCARLEAKGIRCWIAPRDVLAGSEYSESILTAIEQCRAMVLVFSAHANESQHIRREVERAMSKGKVILPFRIQDVLPSGALEFCISNTHWLDALTPPLEAHIETLGDTLSRLLPSLPATGGHAPSIAPRPSAESPTEKAEHQILHGAGRMANAIKATLGPMSRNVIIARKQGDPLITSDSGQIARELELKDPLENVGAQMIRAVVNRIDRTVRDGRATGAILAYALAREGTSLLAAGAHPAQMKRGIEQAVKVVIGIRDAEGKWTEGGALGKLSKAVDQDSLAQISTISASGDQEIGSILAHAMNTVGKDGVITVEESKSVYTSLETVDGMQFDRGFLSPSFVTDAERQEAVLDNCFILFYEKEIGTVKDMLPLLEQIARSGKPLLVVAQDVVGEALATLVVNKQRGTLNVAAVKAPGFGDRRKAMLSDMAILTGGKAITEDLGMKLDDVKLEDLGRAMRVIVDKANTTIVDGAGAAREIEARVKEIRLQIEETASDYDREKLLERIAKLVGGVAVIKVGSDTEAALKAKKAHVEDALHATRAAIEDGIVPGGGVALLRAGRTLEKLSLVGNALAGATIVMRACEEPFRYLASTAGLDEEESVRTVLAQSNVNYGLDVVTGEWKDLVAGGIVDSAKVMSVALEAAATEALSFLTSDTGVFEA
jgi:chaperonin GroEL